MVTELVSMIVPIYNVENYLEKCVDSLLRQTYKDIEILLIDDGSTDNSSKICDEFAEKDARIKVFHKKNGGLSDARNYGIERSKGKYICFVDSDDFVNDDYIEFLYKGLIKNNADISICGFTNYFNNKKMICKLNPVKRKIYNKMDAHIYLNVLGYFDVASWNKMYKKELFENIRFPVGKTCEDWRIMFRIIDKTNVIYYDSSIKYYYRRRENSITSTKIIRLDAVEAALSAIEFYEEKKYTKVLPYAYQSLMIACLGIINSMIDCNDYSKFDYIYNIKCKYKNKFTYKKLKLRKKIQLFFFIISTKTYMEFLRYLRKGK